MKNKIHRTLTLGLAAVALAGCAATEMDSTGQKTRTVTHESAAAKIDPLAIYQRPGFVVKMDDGRLWVFREGSKELADFEAKGELAKHVIRPAAGPGRVTLKAPDADTIDEYRLSRPGFVVKMDDGRLWVFCEGSKELADFEAKGELAKHVIRPAAGPGRVTLKAPDADTIDAYLAAQ